MKLNYVNKNLVADEKVLYPAEVHWFIFAIAFAWFLLSLVVAAIATVTEVKLLFFVVACLLAVTVFHLIKAALYRYSTELVVTSNRVIAKVGLIRRKTTELNHARIESFNINQSVLGRIFNFGTIEVSGTGSGVTKIQNIAAPLDFRRQAMQVSDKLQQEQRNKGE